MAADSESTTIKGLSTGNAAPEPPKAADPEPASPAPAEGEAVPAAGEDELTDEQKDEQARRDARDAYLRAWPLDAEDIERR